MTERIYIPTSQGILQLKPSLHSSGNRELAHANSFCNMKKLLWLPVDYQLSRFAVNDTANLIVKLFSYLLILPLSRLHISSQLLTFIAGKGFLGFVGC